MNTLKKMLKRNSKMISILALGAFFAAPGAAVAAPGARCLNLQKVFEEMSRPGIEVRSTLTHVKTDLKGIYPASLAGFLSGKLRSREEDPANYKLIQNGCESISVPIGEPTPGVPANLTLRIISSSPDELVISSIPDELDTPTYDVIKFRRVSKGKLIYMGKEFATVQDPRCTSQETKGIELETASTIVWGPKGTLKDQVISENLRNLLSEVLKDAANPKCPQINNGLFKPENGGTYQGTGGGGTSSEHGPGEHSASPGI
ncbi:MAG: hypothetical protein NDJ89_11305 [Oligoflexia bacterium]|nr:hypothetical protein [Oligoflexia bacterium]